MKRGHEPVHLGRIRGCVDRDIGTAEELLVDLLQAMRGPLTDRRVIAARPGRKPRAGRVPNPQPVDDVLANETIPDFQEAEEMVVGPIFQHQDDNVLETQAW